MENSNFHVLSKSELTQITGGSVWERFWSYVGNKVGTALADIGMGHMPTREQMENGGYWNYYNPNDPLL